MLVTAGLVTLAFAGAPAPLPSRPAPVARCAPFTLMSAPATRPRLVPRTMPDVLLARRFGDLRPRCFRLMRG